ncbi:hypothetical protein [Halorussus ruber]|uniref:hypothetical protein n=1 Tax=Halorussus ruber TaxID=1126238 RepID=UPI001091AC14|nr:hypothetical protein [Halorussus ruber]
MVSVDVGALDGDSVDATDGGTYKFAVHGFDNVSGFELPYDEIHYEDTNRWHLEGYFDPVPDDSYKAYYPRYANFGIANPHDDFYQKFSAPSPTEDEMSSGGDFNLPSEVGDAFDVIAGLDPYLSMTKAAIEMKLSGDSGSVTDTANYDGVDWHIPMDSYDAGLPDSQETAAGARIDIYNQAKASEWQNQILDASSEFGFKSIDGITNQTLYHTTPTASCNPEYLIPE